MRKILLVDDDAAVTRCIRAVLGKWTNYVVREINDSRHAHAAAREFAPHVIVLDIDMPHKDGSDVAIELRSDKRTREIPIVFLSGLCEPEDQTLSPGEPGKDWLMAKPFHLRTFLSVVRHLADPVGRAAVAELSVAGRGCRA
jgi:DNA-binding response OmpR family regulator